MWYAFTYTNGPIWGLHSIESFANHHRADRAVVAYVRPLTWTPGAVITVQSRELSYSLETK